MKIIYVFLAAMTMMIAAHAQDTFSICAVDSVTGQAGSAGATCISSAAISAIISSDVHPGVGVVHTQASWDSLNRNYARTMMNAGYSPQQIVDSVTINDCIGDSTIRQYGVVDLNSGSPRSAGFTGSACFNYKNHITGPGYSIQGNILLGQQILDSMQSRFLNTPGSLACKLMAALQGAKVVGADTRCTSHGISSFSAFLRVANPADLPSNLFLDLNVNTYPANLEPIDSLQVLFNNVGGCTVVINETGNENMGQLSVSWNEKENTLKIIFGNKISAEGCALKLTDMAGRVIQLNTVSENQRVAEWKIKNHAAGIYIVDAVTSKTKKHFSVKAALN